MPNQKRKYFFSEIKKQSHLSYESGKTRSEIIREYDLIASMYDKWAEKKRVLELLNGQENYTFEEVKLSILREENQRLAKENKVLKQVVQIMGKD